MPQNPSSAFRAVAKDRRELYEFAFGSRLDIQSSAYPVACNLKAGEERSDILALHNPHARFAFYDAMLERGARLQIDYFRWEGCPSCSACKSIRYPVQDFSPTKKQRKLLENVQDFRFLHFPEGFKTQQQNEEHFRLLLRHDRNRFQDKDIPSFPDNPDFLKYAVLEMRDKAGHLVGGGFAIKTPNALVGQSYYYEPALQPVEPGKVLTMQFIQAASDMGKTYLYPGTWLEGFPAYATKSQFKPYELYHQGKWHGFHTSAPSLPCTP